MARTIRSASERFHSKTRVLPNGCIEWLGSRNNKGYGTFYSGPGKYVVAHRWAYTSNKGAIPEGKRLDHLCRHRWCVNPDHLEPVTQRENLLRGDTIAARHAAVTHCPARHPYAGVNLYVVPKSGHRQCRTCTRVNQAARAAERKG